MIEYGNYRPHNLAKAKRELKAYLDALSNDDAATKFNSKQVNQNIRSVLIMYSHADITSSLNFKFEY